MSSAFLIFDLIGGSVTLECERGARLIQPGFDDGKEASV